MNFLISFQMGLLNSVHFSIPLLLTTFATCHFLLSLFCAFVGNSWAHEVFACLGSQFSFVNRLGYFLQYWSDNFFFEIHVLRLIFSCRMRWFFQFQLFFGFIQPVVALDIYFFDSLNILYCSGLLEIINFTSFLCSKMLTSSQLFSIFAFYKKLFITYRTFPFMTKLNN